MSINNNEQEVLNQEVEQEKEEQKTEQSKKKKDLDYKYN